MPVENPEGPHHSFQDEIKLWIYEWAFSDFFHQKWREKAAKFAHKHTYLIR
jgi:hypothetical protein